MTADPGPRDFIPKEIREVFAQFLADNRSGNLTMNVSQGRILGYKIEDIRRLGTAK